MTRPGLRRFDSLADFVEEAPAARGRAELLVVSSGVRGLSVLAGRFAEVATAHGVPVTSVGVRPSLVKQEPLRAARASVSSIDQLRHRRRWRMTPGRAHFADAAKNYAGVLVAGIGPGLAVVPPIAELAPRTALVIDVTMDLHARQNGWRRHPGVRWEAAAERKLFSSVDLLISISEWARSSAVRDLGVPLGRTDVIPPVCRARPIPTASPERAPRPLRLVSIGSPWIRKGMDRTLDWLRSRPDLDVELHLIGDAPPGAAEDGRVTVHGWLEPSSFHADLLPTFDLLVHPTRRDQSATVVAEAAWAGVPAVCARQGGIEELVDHDLTGWMLSDGDSSLHAALDELVAAPDKLWAAGLAARQKAEALFDADVRYRPVVEWLASGGPLPVGTGQR